jgi:hypothetical protein
MLRRLGLGLTACSIAACTLAARRPERLPDGSYRTSCSIPLTKCLETFETICESHGYDVISASESRNRPDLREIPDVQVASEAHVRCKQGKPLFGSSDGNPAPSQADPPAPAPPETAPKAELCREPPSRDRDTHCRE